MSTEPAQVQDEGISDADAAAAEAMLAASGMVVPETRGGSDVNLDVILDVPVTLSLEVGRTRLPIRSLAAAEPGFRRGTGAGGRGRAA